MGPAVAARQSSSAQAPRKLVHSALSWIDAGRPAPWTADTSYHLMILVQLSYRADAQTPRPLVVFSIGRNVSPSTYRDLADALADAGYVVAIVDHVGERSGQRLPNGTSVPYRL